MKGKIKASRGQSWRLLGVHQDKSSSECSARQAAPPCCPTALRTSCPTDRALSWPRIMSEVWEGFLVCWLPWILSCPISARVSIFSLLLDAPNVFFSQWAAQLVKKHFLLPILIYCLSPSLNLYLFLHVRKRKQQDHLCWCLCHSKSLGVSLCWWCMQSIRTCSDGSWSPSCDPPWEWLWAQSYWGSIVSPPWAAEPRSDLPCWPSSRHILPDLPSRYTPNEKHHPSPISWHRQRACCDLHLLWHANTWFWIISSLQSGKTKSIFVYGLFLFLTFLLGGKQWEIVIL